MNTFQFDTITADQALNIETDDVVQFSAGSANAATVIFGAAGITVSLGARSVVFGADITVVSASQHLTFPDGSHLVIGGPRAEQFDGGPGNDGLFGGDGNDTLAGHGGANLLQGNQGDDRLLTDAGADTIYGGQGNDVISTGLGVAGEAGDFAQGNKGDDSLSGGAGADILLGGQGADTIEGGAGDDTLSGDRGADVLVGGAGRDIFHLTDDGATDRILDFNSVVEGDRIQVDPGVTFQVAQVGQDTIITLAGGSQVVLVGVSMSTLHGDWIFNG